MNISELGQFVAAARWRGLDLGEITIKGKDTKTVSCTIPRRHLSSLDDMCIVYGWTFHTTHDSFLAKGHGRVQIHLDGRTSP